jgi:hypothetical protein
MTQHYDERPASDAEPMLVGEDAALATRLERDGAAWRAQVPPNERLNAWVHAIPSAQPHTAQPGDAGHQSAQVEWLFEDSGPATGIPAGIVRGPSRRPDGWAAGIGAVVVVGLIAVLLLGVRAVHDLQPAGLGTGQPTATPTPAPLETPTATYSPAAKYIASMITAKGVDAANQPIEPTSQFTPRVSVYVIVLVKHVPAGQHTLTIRWFLNGRRVQQPSTVVTSIALTSASVGVFFTCAYQLDGKGTAKLYWDLPATTSDAQADAWLVREVRFAVDPAGGPLTPGPTPTPGPTVTPGPTPVPSPTR